MLQDFFEKIDGISSINLQLYLITRSLKNNVKKKSKALDKYKYNIHQIDITDDVREHLYILTKEQIEFALKKKLSVIEYDVIADDTENILTYSILHKATAFSSVLNEQLEAKSQIPRISNFEELIRNEDIWAYCIGFNIQSEEWIYTFRKIQATKVATDDGGKWLRGYFNTKSNQLELIQGQTINLDKRIDCMYFENIFYILKKTCFEQIVGLEDEYKEQARLVVDELEATGIFQNLQFLREQIEETPSIHKKLVRLQKLNYHLSITPHAVQKMEAVGQQFGETIKKDSSGKIVIECEDDLEIVLKLFCDYYKEGKVFGKNYGTYSGKELTSVNNN